MTFSAKQRQFFKRVSIVAVATLVSAVAAQMVLGIFVAIMYLVDVTASSRNILNALLFIVGLGLSVLSFVACYRRIREFLRKELHDKIWVEKSCGKRGRCFYLLHS